MNTSTDSALWATFRLLQHCFPAFLRLFSMKITATALPVYPVLSALFSILFYFGSSIRSENMNKPTVCISNMISAYRSHQECQSSSTIYSSRSVKGTFTNHPIQLTAPPHHPLAPHAIIFAPFCRSHAPLSSLASPLVSLSSFAFLPISQGDPSTLRTCIPSPALCFCAQVFLVKSSTRSETSQESMSIWLQLHSPFIQCKSSSRLPSKP